jgi:2-hydroxychromene-2-carboxylate isomerase
MSIALEFYFDFSSPYGYVASEKVEALAARHGCTAQWRPILLGAAFKLTGGAPLPGVPLKGDYALRDFSRNARYHGVEYRHPSRFPFSALTPSRAFYWADGKAPTRAKLLARALFRACYVEDIDISVLENCVAVCAKSGYDAGEVLSGINDPATKERTRSEVDSALAKGVFGSPFFIVGGEPFWGSDRLNQVERWLARGGW